MNSAGKSTESAAEGITFSGKETAGGSLSGEAREKRGPKVQAGKPVNLSGKRTEPKLTLVSMLLLFAGLLRNGEARDHLYSAHNDN